MERARVSQLLVLPWRSGPENGRRVLAAIDGARRIVRAWFQAPRMAGVSSAWLHEHEIESAKRGQE